MSTNRLPSAQAELRDDFAIAIINGYIGRWGAYVNINKEKLKEMWEKAYEVADCGMEVRQAEPEG